MWGHLPSKELVFIEMSLRKNISVLLQKDDYKYAMIYLWRRLCHQFYVVLPHLNMENLQLFCKKLYLVSLKVH